MVWIEEIIFVGVYLLISKMNNTSIQQIIRSCLKRRKCPESPVSGDTAEAQNTGAKPANETRDLRHMTIEFQRCGGNTVHIHVLSIAEVTSIEQSIICISVSNRNVKH
jgi:hypothetical protein